MRVLGRVERFRDRLQLEVRSLEAAEEADPAEMAPAMRRDAAELDGFLEFLAAEIAHPGLRATVARFVEDEALRAALRGLPAAETHHAYAGGLLEHTVGVATLCREAAQLHPRLRADLVLAAALLHDVGRTAELERGPTFRATEEGRLLGHVHLGLRLVEERAAASRPSFVTRAVEIARRRRDREASASTVKIAASAGEVMLTDGAALAATLTVIVTTLLVVTAPEVVGGAGGERVAFRPPTLLQVKEYGAVVSSPSFVVPLKNSTFVTVPSASEAVAA